MKDILDNLGTEVLSEDAKSSIVEAFDKAVAEKIDEAFDVKVAEKALELTEAKDAEYKALLAESEAKFVAEAKEFKDKLVDTIDAYVAQYVAEQVSESVEDMKNDIAVAKSKAIVEAFEKLGLSVKTEELDEGVAARDAKVEELKAELNKVINENIDLRMEILGAKKSAIVESAFAGLTEIQKDKATALVEALGDIRDVEEFSKKVELVVESVSEKPAPVASIEEHAKVVTEAKTKPSFTGKHL